MPDKPVRVAADIIKIRCLRRESLRTAAGEASSLKVPTIIFRTIN